MEIFNQHFMNFYMTPPKPNSGAYQKTLNIGDAPNNFFSGSNKHQILILLHS